jgi:hypothetical protein
MIAMHSYFCLVGFSKKRNQHCLTLMLMKKNVVKSNDFGGDSSSENPKFTHQGASSASTSAPIAALFKRIESRRKFAL